MLKKLISASLILSLLLLPSCRRIDKGDAETTDTESMDSAMITTEGPEETSSPDTTVPETTADDTTTPEVETEKATEPVTEAVTEPVTEAVTEPPADSGEYIGTLYTRGQLNAMDKTKNGYGPGVQFDSDNRPYGATNAQAKYEKYNVAFIAPKDNNIYLTFDLGYENGYTEKILDVLKDKDAKGVFFATLSYCKSNPHIVKRIIDEGHVLGNHSVNHLSMPTLSLDRMEYEIMEMHNYIYSSYGYTMTLFRPPMGEFSVQSLALTQSLGYKTVHWSFAYYDYDTANQPEHSAALTKVTGAAHGGAIYLLHAVSATNTAILPQVIDSFRASGYTVALYK